MKKLLSLVLLLNVIGAYAANLDSLLRVGTDKKNSMTDRGAALLAWAGQSGDTTAVAEGYMQQAEDLARKAKNDKLLSEVLEHRYYWYKAKGQMIKAFRKILDHNELATQTLDTLLLARGYYLQGQLYLDIEVLPLAIESEKKAAHYFKSLGKKSDLAYHLYLLGWYSFNNGEYKNSLQYFLDSYELQKKTGVDDAGLCEITGWIGNAYSGINEYRDAFKYRFLSLSHARKVAEKTNDGYYLGEAYRYLGNIHRKMGNLDSVLQYHTLALENYNKTGFVDRQGLMMIELANTQYELKNYTEAEKWMNQVNENLSKYDMFVIQMFEKQAGDIYAKSGNSAKALQFYIRYMNRRDSLEEAMQKNNLLLGNIKFQFENELEKLGESKKKRDMEELHKRDVYNARLLLIISVSVVLVLFAVYAWYSKRRYNKLLREMGK